MTGASVTNKGIFYEHGKEPPLEGPPKLHLLIESNEEYRARGFWSYYLVDTHGFNPFRLNKQSGRLRGYLSKHLRLHYRQKCAILLVPWGDTVFYRRFPIHVSDNHHSIHLCPSELNQLFIKLQSTV